MLIKRTGVLVILLCALLGATLAAQSYVPNRVFDAVRGTFSDFETMAADLAGADVVFIGEQHDDANTHRLELAVLEALARRNRPVVLSLEMFERDVQEPLDHFALGHMDEAEFLKASRPWPRYGTDYKPLVDLAIAKNWQVVAANVPRPIASEVAKSGLDVLQTKSDADRKLFARDLVCPTNDEYFKRFGEVMGGGGAHAAGAGADEAAKSVERYYFSQCVKDETMAESIANAYAWAAIGSVHSIVVHVTGAFHSDYGQGTVVRAKRRMPGKRMVVLSMKPVADLDTLLPDDDDRRVGQYVVYTVKR
jgi:uncharacterized iron-regulated protein